MNKELRQIQSKLDLLDQTKQPVKQLLFDFLNSACPEARTQAELEALLNSYYMNLRNKESSLRPTLLKQISLQL